MVFTFNDLLLEARLEIQGFVMADLNWNYTLPAWKLYSGSRSKLYSKVTVTNWNKPCVQIKILSALFGWIKHTDLVPYYNLEMTSSYQNRSIWRIWREFDVLNQCVSGEDVDLLSQNYRRAITGSILPVALVPAIAFRGYGEQQGKWLNQ